MAELDGLKKRVGQIDLRLKTAHSARERESAALMESWEQIRDRFQDQSAEIIKLRSQIADLEDARDDLLKMVHGLLEAVECGLDSMADETVPKIKKMAGQLLSNNKNQFQAAPEDESGDEPGRDLVPAQAPSSAGRSFHDDLLSAIEQSIDSTNEEDFVQQIPKSASPKLVAQTEKAVPVSPGIRNLVARIENAVGGNFLEPPFAKDDEKPEGDDDLTRDLREIEALRDELQGLRHRISAGAL